MIEYADDCLVFASNKDEKIATLSLESNIHYFANYFREHQFNLNSSNTEFICFSKQNEQRKNLGHNISRYQSYPKSNESKNLGQINDSSLSFMYQVKQTLKKMVQGIKTIDSFGTQLPTSCAEVLLHSIILSHLNYSALFIQHIRKPH